MTSTQKNLVTADDGTQLVIVTPKFTATTMTYVDYKISLALGKLLSFEKEETFASLNKIQETLSKVFSAHENKTYWKGHFTATFPFSRAFEAEALCTAIHWFHAVEPIVSVDYVTKTITVESLGYAA